MAKYPGAIGGSVLSPEAGVAPRDLAPQLPSKEEVLLHPKSAQVPENVSAQFLITDMLADAATATTFDNLVEYAKRLPPEMQAKFVKDSMKRMTSLLEPIAIAVISLIVGFVALSLVLALSSVYEGVV